MQLFYQIALTSRQDLHITPDTKSGFEMALLRMLAFQMSPVPADQQRPVLEHANPGKDITPPDIEASSLPQELPSSSEVNTEPELVNDPVLSNDVLINELEQGVDNNASSLQESHDHQKTEKLAETDNEVGQTGFVEEKAQDTQSFIAQPNAEVEKKTLNNAQNSEPEGWNADVIELGLTGMTLNFMLNSVVVLSLPEISVFVESGHFRLFNENHEKRIREALLAFYAGSTSVEFKEGLKNEQETPMMWRDRKLQEKKAYAKELIFNDPYVHEILDAFQGNLIEQSIQPED